MAEANCDVQSTQTLRWMDEHKELVLFLQEVICLRRPRWYLGLISGCHVIWYLLFVTTKPVLAKLSLVSLSLVLGNAAFNLLRQHDLLSTATIPSPLPASTSIKLLPLRTLPQLWELYDASKRQCRHCIDSSRTMHQRSPGQLTFLLCTLCLVMIFVFEHVPASLVAYVSMLGLLATPVLDRYLPARRVLGKAAPIIQTTTATAMALVNRFFERLPDELIVVTDAPLTSPSGSLLNLASRQPSSLTDDSLFDLTSRQASTNATLLDLNSPDGRARGWSVLHDNGNNHDNDDELMEETRGRGWSVLHDDSSAQAMPASPGLRSSETEEGFQNISFT